jgi:hypothetical protein
MLVGMSPKVPGADLYRRSRTRNSAQARATIWPELFQEFRLRYN